MQSSGPCRLLITRLVSGSVIYVVVDDIYTVIPRDVLEPFHKHLNSIEPCIQFTGRRQEDFRGVAAFGVCAQVFVPKQEEAKG